MDSWSSTGLGGGSANNEQNSDRATTTANMDSARPTPLRDPNDLNQNLSQGVNALQDMLIAHEITMDGEFRLKPRSPPQNSLEKAVAENVKKAFWNLLREDLAATPPRYGQALRLLEDVKKGLSDAVLPHQTKMIQNIREVLDSDVIKQQTEAGVLDFKAYADYVLGVMLKICASARDERIFELQKSTDIVETFKGILEVLDLMRLDLANTSILIARPDIIMHSIEYEKNKFNEFLKTREGLEDCLRHTKVWLKKQMGTTDKPRTKEQVLTNAYLSLLEWDESKEFPETLMFDIARVLDLRSRVLRLVCSASTYTVALSQTPSIKEVASLKQSLYTDIATLMATVRTNKDFEDVLPNIILQIIKQIKETLATHKQAELSVEEEKAIEACLKQISSPTNSIRLILKQRLIEYFRLCLESTRGPIGIDMPSAWQPWKNDIVPLAAGYCRLTIHNRGVFGEHYYNIMEEAQRSIDVD